MIDLAGGRGPASYEAIADSGFSVGIGRWDDNRELIEWMRQHNADPAHPTKLNFYGALPSDQGTTKSPRQTIELALSVADFDVIAFLRSVTYTRGALPLQG